MIDECVYKYTNSNASLIIGVFVDDILCLETDKDIIDWFRLQLSDKFTVTMKSTVDSFLGMHITRYLLSKRICLSQPGYIISLMSRFGIDTTSSIHFPTALMSLLDMQNPSPIPLTPTQQKKYANCGLSPISIYTRFRDFTFS